MFILSFGFIAGVALGSIIPISIGFFVYYILCLAIIFFYQFFIRKEDRRILNILALFVLGGLFGVGRVYISDLYSQSQLVSFVGQNISADGIVVGEPDIRDTNTKLTIGLRNIYLATSTVSVREKILVSVPMYPEFKYGDKVKFRGVLSEPKEFETDGRVFDYKGYLRVRGVWYTSSFSQVQFVSSGHGSIIKTFLYKIKNSFTSSINNSLPHPESALLSGLLLGSKQSLGKELLEEFQRTGVSHIVVLSGYNIAIVAESVMSFFKFLPKNFAFGTGALGIVLFIILSGGGASATRAGIMVLVALYAKHSNRDYKASRILGFTIVLMLVPNPLLLMFDPSFQLSVLATIGLIFVTPHITPYLSRVTERFGLREIISSTIATQITVLPYLVYNMGLLSVVSLPVNILILGTIPLTMFLGFITGVAGLISLYLSFIPALFTHVLLWYQLFIVHIGSSIPFGALKLPAFSPVVLILVYFSIFTILYFLKNKK